jgi:hypothetical protein
LWIIGNWRLHGSIPGRVCLLEVWIGRCQVVVLPGVTCFGLSGRPLSDQGPGVVLQGNMVMLEERSWKMMWKKKKTENILKVE